MSNVSTSFDITENIPKLPVGPTRPNPGPILLIVARTAENVVSQSYPSIPTITSDMTNISVYRARYIYCPEYRIINSLAIHPKNLNTPRMNLF